MQKHQFFPNRKWKIFAGGMVLLAALLITSGLGLARQEQPPEPPGSSIHPTFPLLDEAGVNVLESGEAVSARITCGSCHDTAFIAGHSEHAAVGLDELPYPADTGDVEDADVEMNCFLCHTEHPNNATRLEAIEEGQAGWAATAALLGSGIVEQVGGDYLYQAGAFAADGELLPEFLDIQNPTSANCGQCHGTVHTDLSRPLVLNENPLENWRGLTTGQVFSGQRLADSGLNLAGKDNLTLPFDVHAERNLACTDCHHAQNNPVFFEESSATRPEHLTFDPRRLEMGEYLQQPDHRFGSGDDTGEAMRRCEGCHNSTTPHTWLPYRERHMTAVSCETCHIPQSYTPALEQVDWTVVQADGSPRIELRGQAADGLIEGYSPVLMLKKNVEGDARLAPYNLVTTWYWVAGDIAQPVSQADLQTAWLEQGRYRQDVVAALDEDRNGTLDQAELALDSEEKVQAIAARLEEIGLENPRIQGEVQPYQLNHNVASGEWATRDCKTCHSANSRVTQPLQLSTYIPGGAMPAFAAGTGAMFDGELHRSENGQLYYRPGVEKDSLYILGQNAVAWVDLLGGLAFLGVLLGTAGHGTLRFLATLRRPQPAGQATQVYMYSVYERLWHWLQTFTILGLLFTGLVIHKPDTFGIFSFRHIVLVHNVLAGILLLNAGLSLFYHLVSGEIRQYIPRPAGFFDQAIEQGLFYLRGIFKGEPHPFEKTPDRKLNPLQQVTYFAILNLLLPLQVITGALMWGAQQWPDITARLGGLPFLAPFHTLVAWLFASFIVAHVYLTTTGHTTFASIRAMMMGWDDVEAHIPAEEVGD